MYYMKGTHTSTNNNSIILFPSLRRIAPLCQDNSPLMEKCMHICAMQSPSAVKFKHLDASGGSQQVPVSPKKPLGSLLQSQEALLLHPTTCPTTLLSPKPRELLLLTHYGLQKLTCPVIDLGRTRPVFRTGHFTLQVIKYQSFIM